MLSNKKKAKILGMPIGTASNRLRKKILFSLVQQTEQDICFRCDQKIERIKELSIEHKIPWLNSENPIELFFDLENIAFSHLACNIRGRNAQRFPKNIICPDCKKERQIGRNGWYHIKRGYRSGRCISCSRKNYSA